MDTGRPLATYTWDTFFLLQFDLSSEYVNSPVVEPAFRAFMVHKAMDIFLLYQAPSTWSNKQSMQIVITTIWNFLQRLIPLKDFSFFFD